EETIKTLFISAVNKLLADRDEILGNFELIKYTVFDTADLEKEQAELQSEIEVVAGMIQQAISENAHFALDQAEYQARYNELVDRFDLAKARHTAVTEEITDKQTRLSTINAFLYTLSKQDNLLTEFDEKLWCSLVDYATVYDKDDVRFTFKDGTKIQA
ncbi:MAG: recombinase family protein, partial [Syntrophomonadaceae bacterium]|nr:recombinase family protein [Syntrophomonadaceae bacterium]